jgi:Arc/MetJ-type ribon-helix-helix transcriptional regulator
MHDTARTLYYNFVMRDPKNKDTTISVRVSGEEERVLRRYARRRRSSVSDVIRDAVRVLVDQPAKDRPYDEIADLIGCVSGLPSDLSEGTGARFADIVQEKAGRRR